MQMIFLFFYDYFSRRKIQLVITFVVVTAILAWCASQVKIEQDVSKFFPADKTFEKTNNVLKNSKFSDRLVFFVSSADTNTVDRDKLIEYSDSLAQQISSKIDLQYVRKITSTVDDELMISLFDAVTGGLPVFLNEEDYTVIDSLSKPENIPAIMDDNYHQAISPTGFAMKNIIVKDPLGISKLVFKRLQQVQGNQEYDVYSDHLFSKDGRTLIFFVEARYPSNNTGKNSEFLAQVDQLIANARSKDGNIETTYFGGTAVAAGNATQIRSDTYLTLSIMIVLMAVFLFGFLRKWSAPLLIMVPVIFGALFSLTMIWFIQGSLSVLALAAGSIVLGIAINYSLHFLIHLKHTHDVRDVIADLAPPLTLGSTTTVLAFLCLRFANAPLLGDVGLFAGFSLIGAALCSLIFLPHFVNDKYFSSIKGKIWTASISVPTKVRRVIIVLILALTPVMLYFAGSVSFNSNMAELNFMTPKLKVAEKKLNEVTHQNSQAIYVINDGKNLESALRASERTENLLRDLKDKRLVYKYSSVAPFVLSDSIQNVRRQKWTSFWNADRIKTTHDALSKEITRLKFSPAILQNFDSLVSGKHKSMQDFQEMIMKTLPGDYIVKGDGTTSVVSLVSIDRSRSEEFYNAIGHSDNRFAIDNQRMTNMLVSYVHDDFTFIVTFTSILVFVVLLISYGRIELTLMTFLPMAISWVWILGLMALLGIEFNIVNVMISTFIFGLGDDYSIFTMDGLQRRSNVGQKLLPSINESILLSALTTICGLGVLIFAQHPALKSIALISIIGIVTVVIVSQTIQPMLFDFFIDSRIRKKRSPMTFFRIVATIVTYSLFILGSLISTLIGFVIITLIPIRLKRRKLLYHRMLQMFTALCFRCGLFIKHHIYIDKDQFKKPAVIIANHQSFIDILLTVAMHPKVLLLTNRWVWNSPIFGWVVRIAGFYPVDQGFEGSVSQLKEYVAEGYSIVVFPEGTRSPDGTVGRFHKGAFYLAEQLQLPIAPLMLYGTGVSIPKGTFYIGMTEIGMKFLPTIEPGDTTFGTTYSERAKQVGRYFKREFELFKEEIHTPYHFRFKLIDTFIYKGPQLEWYLRIKLRAENYYNDYHALIPKNASVLDLGCGYGFLPYLLHFINPDRQILGVDHDEEKIAIAQHGFSRGETLQFVQGDVTQFDIQSYDVIILNDVLHYLTSTQQSDLLDRCVDALPEGGQLIIREGDADNKESHSRTRLTEFFSTKVLKFNKKSEELTFVSGEQLRSFAQRRGLEMSVAGRQKFTSNVIFVFKKSSAR